MSSGRTRGQRESQDVRPADRVRTGLGIMAVCHPHHGFPATSGPVTIAAQGSSNVLRAAPVFNGGRLAAGFPQPSPHAL